jgi:hypothetical protein
MKEADGSCQTFSFPSASNLATHTKPGSIVIEKFKVVTVRLWIELSVDSLSFFDKGVKKMQDRNIHKN